ncbi:MAG: type II toxin-antitoxin system death-on-curing family toxin [Tenericutes bacterium]|jgi:death-on-curing protein|nr:type II toxin-antitoxin system death-on-curing family toxin [Mycoplasmatota bacterium]
MIFTKELVIKIHKRIIETSGGALGLKDIGLLDSAVSSIYQTYDSKELYPTLLEKAARLCYALNKNHPFVDGNKRISMHMLALFLRFHDIDYSPTNDEVIRVGISLADGSMNDKDLLIWLKQITK